MKTPEEDEDIWQAFARVLSQFPDIPKEELLDEVHAQAKQSWIEGYNAGIKWRDENPPWVSVKDRMPEDEQEVIISWIAETVSGKTFRTYDVATYSTLTGNFSGWRKYPEVTEWLPVIPPGPKGES